jgi:hypothetical protein
MDGVIGKSIVIVVFVVVITLIAVIEMHGQHP